MKADKALRGVNFGGWLILEKWMTPALFEGTDAAVDEFTFMQTPGAREKLRKHQKTFITDADFAWLAKHSIQLVRIPVGYWVINGDDPYVASIGRLDWAFEAAKKHGIKILLDVHGLPGSQNGQDHSGRKGPKKWKSSKTYIANGIAATLKLAERYAHHEALWAFQLINEPPVGLFQIRLRRYYNRLYKAVSAVLPEGVPVVFSDAFTPRLMAAAVSSNKRTPVMMDIHWYHFIGFGWLKPQRYEWVLRHRARLLRRLKRWNGVIIGEWSGTYSQKIFDKFPQAEHTELVKRHIKAQINAYEPADAWFYWSYKTEQPGVWNFKSLVEDGTIEL